PGLVAAFTDAALLTVSNRGPPSVTGPTQEFAGIPAPEMGRPASGAVIDGSVMTSLPIAPFTPVVSVRDPGVRLPPPRTYFGSFTASPVRLDGLSIKALSPGPGYTWLPFASFSSGVFGPVGSIG